jgi:membrane associated rhomboid family serine protease
MKPLDHPSVSPPENGRLTQNTAAMLGLRRRYSVDDWNGEGLGARRMGPGGPWPMKCSNRGDMIPLSDENPTLRFPVVTGLLLVSLGLVWFFVQGAGLDERTLAASVCNLGMVPGELTGLAPRDAAVPIAKNLACVVDREPVNWLTPLTSMFLHGGWGHLLGNALFLWVFGNNVEDSMPRGRFVVFYTFCGLAAAAAQVAIDPTSPVPMVGASGAISGVMGGYLVLYPKVRVKVLFVWVIFLQILRVPAYVVLLLWAAYQVVLGLPQLTTIDEKVSSGVAVWAHIGGFAAGLMFIKLFASRDLVEKHRRLRASSYSQVPQR